MLTAPSEVFVKERGNCDRMFHQIVLAITCVIVYGVNRLGDNEMATYDPNNAYMTGFLGRISGHETGGSPDS